VLNNEQLTCGSPNIERIERMINTASRSTIKMLVMSNHKMSPKNYKSNTIVGTAANSNAIGGKKETLTRPATSDL
jgi:hypothetical protein